MKWDGFQHSVAHYQWVYAEITQPSDKPKIDSELETYASRRDWRSVSRLFCLLKWHTVRKYEHIETISGVQPSEREFGWWAVYLMWFITKFMLGFFKSAVSCYMGLLNCFLLFIHQELCSHCPKELTSAKPECPLSIIRVMAPKGILVYFKVYICTLQPLVKPSAKVQFLQFLFI